MTDNCKELMLNISNVLKLSKEIDSHCKNKDIKSVEELYNQMLHIYNTSNFDDCSDPNQKALIIDNLQILLSNVMSIITCMKSGGKHHIDNTKPSIILFFSNNCLNCKKFYPIWKSIVSKYGEKINIIKINADSTKNKSYIEKFNVTEYPTIFFTNKNKEIIPFNYSLSDGQIMQKITNHIDTKLL